MEPHLPSQESGRRVRRQYTAPQIAEYLQAQPPSGLTITAFCQQHGIHPSVFHGWKRRRRQPAADALSFQEVALPTRISPTWVAEIALPTGTVLRLGAQADLTHLRPWLAELLRS